MTKAQIKRMYELMTMFNRECQSYGFTSDECKIFNLATLNVRKYLYLQEHKEDK